MTSFCCVYLLVSCNSDYKDHAYVGYTNDPNHRIRQHNGEIAGGARKTSYKRPWKFVLYVSGFADKISALQFEYAWQHPTHSRLLRKYAQNIKKQGRRHLIRYKLAVLQKMLSECSPWNTMPLNISLCDPSYETLLPSFPSRIVIKSVILKGKRYAPERPTLGFLPQASHNCVICLDPCGALATGCGFHDCGMSVHITCLASWFLKKENTPKLIPTTVAHCPHCTRHQHWSDVVARWRETQEIVAEDSDSEDDEEPVEKKPVISASALSILEKIKKQAQSHNSNKNSSNYF
ncbi:hypothetical protein P9112_004389 [Eukaryota sp. TZLM1-RC]